MCVCVHFDSSSNAIRGWIEGKRRRRKVNSDFLSFDDRMWLNVGRLKSCFLLLLLTMIIHVYALRWKIDYILFACFLFLYLFLYCLQFLFKWNEMILFSRIYYTYTRIYNSFNSLSEYKVDSCRKVEWQTRNHACIHTTFVCNRIATTNISLFVSHSLSLFPYLIPSLSTVFSFKIPICSTFH